MTDTRTVTHKPITFIAVGGASYGNGYRFRITDSELGNFLASCERDVAYHYQIAGLPVPQDLAGPYDGYGRKL